MEQAMEAAAVETARAEDTDARIEAAVNAARARWQEEARVAALSGEERADYELKRRENELSEREQQVIRRELRATALERLAEKDLPKALADAISYTDEQACEKSLEAVEQAFRAAVKQGVEQRLRGRVPTGDVSAVSASELTDDEYYRSLGFKA